MGLIDNNRFMVGHPMMDADHRMLVEYINLLHEAVTSSAPASEQSHHFANLIRQVREHFLREEAFMVQIGYSGLMRHKSEHDMLLEEIVELQVRFNSGSISLTESLFDYLNEWLAFHTVTTDKKLAEVAATLNQ